MGRRALTAIAIMMLVFLSACGEKGECPASCSDGNPCTTDYCSKDTNFQCRSTPIPGCTLECGVPCTGAVGQYMEMKCDPATKQCASDIKAGLKISTSSLTNEMLSMGNKFKVITTFSQPFNMKKDLFNIEMSASQFGRGISDVKIKSVEITGLNAQRQTVTLGDSIINRYIWSTETKANFDMRINFPTSEDFGSFSNIKLRVSYDYKQEISGQVQSKSAAFEITLRGVTFAWLNPGITQSCPASCDDNNLGTADTCDASTDYFCVHTPVPGRCGNYVCDPSENKCTCEADCGPCTGEAGQYLQFLCHDNQCRTMIRQGVLQEPTSIADDRNMNFFHLQNTYRLNSPFNVNADQFQLEFKLYNKQDAVGKVTVTEAKILDLNKEVASAPVMKSMTNLGDTIAAQIPVTTFVGHESDSTYTLKVYVEYEYTTTAGTETRKIDYTKPLGRFTLINPTLP